MNYTIQILPSAEADSNSLPKNIFSKCQKAIFNLENNPRPPGCKKLVGHGGYRIRVGDYRILYEIEDSTKRVYVYRVKHRKEVYR